MSLFHQLDKLNIPLEELNNLSEKEIIRLEKKLKAEVVLGNEIDINQVNQLIDSLRNSQDNLKYVTTQDTKWLRNIISNPRKLITFPINETPKQAAPDEAKQFIEEKFSAEITEYFSTCLKENHYRALHCLLFYHTILPNSILDEIQAKMIQKMEYSIECLNINASGLNRKIFFLYNPFFFKCLNFLDPTITESLLPTLVNLIIRKSETNKTLYRVHFCMGMYLPVSGNLKRVLKQNQQFAMSKGVSQNLDYVKYPKGETRSSSDNLNNGQLKSYFAVFVFVAIIVTASIFIAIALNSSSSNSKNIVEPITINTFIEKALDYQSNYQNKVFPKEIAFNEDTIGFIDMNMNKHLEENVTIYNNSDKHVAIIMGVDFGYSVLCIRPHQKRSTSCIFRTYSIYQGHYPIKFSKFNDAGEYIKGFMFNKFDYKDKNMLKQIRMTPVEIDLNHNYNFEINYGVLELINKEEK